MPTLGIRLERGRDARDLLVCERADGSKTWSRLPPGFPVHDLAHLALESTLGIAQGFYGLVAAGWDIPSFSEPGAAARLPREALWVELVVSVLQTDIAGAASLQERNWMLESAAVGQGLDPCRLLSVDQWESLRRALRELRLRWSRLLPGESLEWSFEPGVASKLG